MCTLVVVEVGFVLALATRNIQFGASSLHGEYFFVSEISTEAVIRGFVVATLVVGSAILAGRTVERAPAATVAVVVASAYAFQSLLVGVGGRGWIVDSGVNPYYKIARHSGIVHVLSRYSSIADLLDVHARSNMPGKTLLYAALVRITTDPDALGYIVAALSTCAGVLAYLVARQVFVSRRTALYALFLYLFLPARIFFDPWLNIVTPAFGLGMIWLYLSWLDRRSRPLAAALGLAIFATALFEPTPLVLFIVVLPLTVRALRDGTLTWAALGRLGSTALATFLAAWALFWAGLGFNLFAAFGHVWSDAARVNALIKRPYAGWLMPNLREFIVNTGIGVSLLAAMRCGAALANRDGAQRSARRRSPADLFTIGVLATIVTLDLLGVNRGEVTRLWIFVAVFVGLIAADQCARLPEWVFLAVLGAAVVQTALENSTVGFTVPPIPVLTSHNLLICDVVLFASVLLVGIWGWLDSGPPPTRRETDGETTRGIRAEIANL